jgi:hypothetical protein
MRVADVFAAAGLAVIVAAAASVTACSAGSKTAADASAPTGSSATGSSAASAGAASAATGNSGSPGTVKNVDVCTALTAAAASQITGTKFTTTKPDTTGGVIFSCEYDGANFALLQISVTTTDGKIGYDSDVSALKTAGYPPNSVTGVGDEAFSMPDPKGNAGSVGASSFASYGARFGDVYISIGGLTYVTADQGRQIVEELHGKL